MAELIFIRVYNATSVAFNELEINEKDSVETFVIKQDIEPKTGVADQKHARDAWLFDEWQGEKWRKAGSKGEGGGLGEGWAEGVFQGGEEEGYS